MNKKNRAGALQKVPTGLAVLDQLTGGGLPARRVTVVLGPAGSGKTVFALQTLLNIARASEPCIFVSFSEPPNQVEEHANAFGWDVAELEKERLVFLDGRARHGTLNTGQFDVTGLLGALRAVRAESGAKFVAFDGIDLMLNLLKDAPTRIQELFRIREWLAAQGITSLLTSTQAEGSPCLEMNWLMNLMADCTLTLGFSRSEGQFTRRIRVEKYRGSAFQENELSLSIGESGIEVSGGVPAAASGLEGKKTAGLYREIQLARKQLNEKLQAMDKFLEIKQAELNFLLEKPISRQRQTSTLRGSAKRSPKAPRDH